MSHLISRLCIAMKENGVKNLTELSLLTNIDVKKLENFPKRGTNNRNVDFVLIDQLSVFFECNANSLVELGEKDISFPVEYTGKSGIVYFLKFENGLTKIGWTSDLKLRKQSLIQENKTGCELIGFVSSSDCETVERVFHTLFIGKRVKGEYFNLCATDLTVIDKFKNGVSKIPRTVETNGVK